MILFSLAFAEPSLTPVVRGVERVTDVQFLQGRMVIVQQDGTLSWAGDDGKVTRWKQLEVIDGGERGLLGLAFDPDYATNGRVVLSWTEKVDGKTLSKVGLWLTKPGSKPGSAPLHPSTVLLEVEQPYSNHNGGGVQFGPDGMLYVGLGDGGKWGDPLGAGQDGRQLLGSMLRLDPDLPAPHVPPDNPFVGNPAVHDAIYAKGLRNPWRFSFAPDGRLVAGDVGQNKWEEVTFVPRGANLGWNQKEGLACYQRDACTGDFVDPFWVYGRDLGISVTGGYVATSGPYAGQYLFGDFGSGRIWRTALPPTGERAEPTLLKDFSIRLSTFGRDEAGRVYAACYEKGVIYRVD